MIIPPFVYDEQAVVVATHRLAHGVRREDRAELWSVVEGRQRLVPT